MKEANSALLTNRILLKWSKNPDSTPWAKASVIVKGLADPLGFAGQVDSYWDAATMSGSTLQDSFLIGSCVVRLSEVNIWMSFVVTHLLTSSRGPHPSGKLLSTGPGPLGLMSSEKPT